MVDQLSSFAAEVTRVAREVGTEGKLGGQAEVRGVARRVERTLKDGLGESHAPVISRHRCGDVSKVATANPLTAISRRKSLSTCVARFCRLKRHQHDGGSAFVVRIGSDARGS